MALDLGVSDQMELFINIHAETKFTVALASSVTLRIQSRSPTCILEVKLSFIEDYDPVQ